MEEIFEDSIAAAEAIGGLRAQLMAQGFDDTDAAAIIVEMMRGNTAQVQYETAKASGLSGLFGRMTR